MKIAITGGTGFVGGHLAAELAAKGHDVGLIARGHDCRSSSVRLLPNVTFVRASVTDERRLRDTFVGCDAVVHLATAPAGADATELRRGDVSSTQRTVAAAQACRVGRFVFLSTSAAHPRAKWEHHIGKWEAEEIVRDSGLSWTIAKADVIYGQGDHLVDGLSERLRSVPVFALAGYGRPAVRPVAIADAARVLATAATTDRLDRLTLPLVGPNAQCPSDVVRLVALALGRRPWFVRVPAIPARRRETLLERLMHIPIGPQTELPTTDELPDDLEPSTPLTVESIRKALAVNGRGSLKTSVWFVTGGSP